MRLFRREKRDAAGTPYSEMAHCECGQVLSEHRRVREQIVKDGKNLGFDVKMECWVCHKVSPWGWHYEFRSERHLKQRNEAWAVEWFSRQYPMLCGKAFIS